MAQVEMRMPKMGESIVEATIIRWLKNPGDKIEADEPVLEIATDKVDSEVPAPVSGTMLKRLFEDGQAVAVGAVIALIGTEASETISSAPVTPVPSSKPLPTAPVSNGIHTKEIIAPAKTFAASRPAIPASRPAIPGRFYSPLVKNIAKTEGISVQELETIPGTGNNGRLTKKDLLSYLPARKSQPELTSSPSVSSVSVAPQPKSAPVTTSAGDEIIEMDRMRKLIADHMVMSKHTSPHVTSFVEADVTSIVTWREKIKVSFEKKEKEKITYTPVFVDAVVKAIRDFPMVNTSVDGTKIIVRKNINIGIATALPSGNLIVPVIRNAERLNLLGLTKAVNDLAGRARQNKLTPDEIQGGTFTISNVGTFGNLMGTPIINQPQVAILATGIIKKKPVVIETSEGDTIGIRHMMFLSLSYDHRIVDGALGGSFLRRIADYLEKFDPEQSL